jgi:YYY domain-containing protein
MTAQALGWWLIVQGIGLIALPIALLVFRRLPGAGYAFAKPLGILLTAYLFWLALSLHVLPNRPGSIVWVLLLLVAVDVFIIRRYGLELRALLESRLGLIVAVELVFAFAFAIAVYLRSFIPEIGGTEKPMDFMLLNAASRDRYYPPDDAWLSGFSVSYYYLGYAIQALLGKLAAVPTAVAFNLGLAGTAALAATAAFGFAYELARLGRAAFRPALAVGGVAVLLVMVIGNLEGVAEFAVANGIARDQLVTLLDISNLDQARESTACVVSLFGGCIAYPNEESSFWWWWRATRISPEATTITEFPFFSFLLGDLHPHVMAIPYVLTVAALGLAFWRAEARLDFSFWRRRPLLPLVSAILLGSLGFLNSWDLPTLAFVLALLVFARGLREAAVSGDHPSTSSGPTESRISRAFEATIGFVLPLVALALLVYAPFYLGFSTQASGFEAVSGGATRPLQSALFWTPLLLVGLALPLTLLARSPEVLRSRRVWRALVLPAGLVMLWALVLAVQDGPSALEDAIVARGWNWLTTLFYGCALAATLLALWSVLEDQPPPEPEQPQKPYFAPGLEGRGMGGEASPRADSDLVAPALVLMTTALLLIFGAELFFVRDVFGSRLNSVFKLYYQAWLLLGVSTAAGAYWVINSWRERNDAMPVAEPREAMPVPAGALGIVAGSRRRAAASGSDQLGLGRRSWLAAVAIVLAGSLLYPLGATLSRTNGLSAATRTLDGLAFARRDQRDDFAAISWLRDRAGPDAKIVEATGGQYSSAARVSTWSGVPAVIGWAGHEIQWGRDGALVGQRQTDVDKAYNNESLAEALAILRKYDVSYVFVGSLERAKYPPAGLQKFEAGLPAAFRSGETVVYRVPIEPASAGAAD